jgi:primosomal protein N'
MADPARALTSEQAAAFSQLRSLADDARFRVALMRGVTGSGTTEGYRRLA